MKKLIQILKESLEENEVISEAFEGTNDVGKFFLVTRPTKDSKKEDIVFNIDVFEFADKVKNGLEIKDVVGIYKQKSDAGKEASQLIKNFETELNELENEMNEFRKNKTELDAKKQAAIERIKKMKGEQ